MAIKFSSRFRILKNLDSNGVSEVYQAEDLKLRRTVAIKVLPQNANCNTEIRLQLLHEAQTTAKLTHPNIATLYELEDENDCFFLILEYVPGNTISQELERNCFDPVTALEIGIQVLEGLRFAHQQGFLHCDLKSANLIRTSYGRVKILDFGLARLNQKSFPEAGSQPDDSFLGLTGTIGYMSPEQIRNEPLDERTDLFSFGVVLYEMITGCQPFQGATPLAVLSSTLNDEPLPLSKFRNDVPLELENIVRRLLVKDRNERYSSTDLVLSEMSHLKKRLSRELVPHAPNHIEEKTPYLVARSPSNRWFPFFYHLRHWILAAGILSALLIIFDRLFLPAQDSQHIRDGVFLFGVTTSLLAYVTLTRKKPWVAPPQAQNLAFRGLQPFQEADRYHFYGRNFDIQAIFNLVTHNEFRFGVLFGESGCGKTSLLKAGVIPILWEQGLAPIYCRLLKEPFAILLEECRKRSHLERHLEESMADYLQRVAKELEAPLLLIFDQFEEFFINFKTRQEREPFRSFITTCFQTEQLPVRFLFSIRSDFLYLISSEFDGHIPEPLASSKRYHLRHFDEQQAQEILEQSTQQASIYLEPGLHHQIAHDLVIGDVVLPSELQIVGQQLQTKRIFTLQAYRRAGGKELLVHSFLEDVILGSGDQEGTKLLLRCLISEDNTRLTLPMEEICKRIQRNPVTTKRMMNLFVESRLIRVIQDEEPWRYELMHEYLIEKINQITGTVMDATQKANRLLRQYLSNYLVDPKTCIPVGKLWFIHYYSDLVRGERERTLLRQSLRWGVFKAGVMGFLLIITTGFAAGVLSIREEWDVKHVKDGHLAAVRRVAFSPDGRWLVSVSEDTTVIIWDFAKRQPVTTCTDHKGLVSSVTFSPNGKWFATGSFDQTVIVWDATRLEKVAVLRDLSAKITAVTFSRDGKMLASTAAEPKRGTVVWETEHWKKIYEFSDGAGDAGTLLFSPQDDFLWVSNTIWNLATGQLAFDGNQSPSHWQLGVAAFSPRSTCFMQLATGSVIFLKMIPSWNTPPLQMLGEYPAHHDNPRAIVISPDGRLAATGSDDILLWDLATRSKLSHLEHTALVWTLDFSPDGKWLVSGHADGSLLVWDVAERQRVANLNEHSGSVQSVTFSPDGRRIASASEDRSVIIWNAESGHKEATLINHQTRVNAAKFSSDGTWLASCDQDGGIRVWNLDQYRIQYAFKSTTTYGLTISPNNCWIVATQEVFETNGQYFMPLNTFRFGAVYGAAFSPDGHWLACGTDKGHILIWDADRWCLIETKHTSNAVISISFLPDGTRFVTGGDDGMVRLFELNPLREVAVVGQHAARVKSVAVSPDGKRVASASDDQTIALWDIHQRKLLTNIGTHTSPVRSVAFSPDGKRLVSGENDKSVQLFTQHHTLWGYRLN